MSVTPNDLQLLIRARLTNESEMLQLHRRGDRNSENIELGRRDNIREIKETK